MKPASEWHVSLNHIFQISQNYNNMYQINPWKKKQINMLPGRGEVGPNWSKECAWAGRGRGASHSSRNTGSSRSTRVWCQHQLPLRWRRRNLAGDRHGSDLAVNSTPPSWMPSHFRCRRPRGWVCICEPPSSSSTQISLHEKDDKQLKEDATTRTNPSIKKRNNKRIDECEGIDATEHRSVVR